jgi:phage terminase small subunit
VGTEKKPRGMSNKIRRFIEAYLETWNATDAARAAQYSWPEKQGQRLLTRPYVQAAISEALAACAMPANEVLARVSQHARVNIAMFLTKVDYIDPRTDLPKTRVEINWENLETYGYLVKSLSWTKAGDPVITLVDSQRALELIGKHQGMFKEQVEHSGSLEVDVNDARANIQRKLAGIAAASGSEAVSEQPDGN